MRTTFFTCCNKKYENFIPIFLHSILYHNYNNSDIEIGVEDLNLDENIIKCINYIKSIYKNKIELRLVNFNGIEIDNKIYNSCPNVIRFIETPIIKNEYVYICDIDIITLQHNIMQIHVDDMLNTGLNYSNIVRPIQNDNKRMTGLHFTKWNNYYPIPNFDDLVIQNFLNHDEVFLYKLIEKNNIISEENIFRPVHGIHISLNRPDIETWGIKKWNKEWLEYRNSVEFLYLEKLFSNEIRDTIKKIDKYYEHRKNIYR